MKIINKIALLVFALAALSACKDYFGEKTSLDFIDLPEFQDRDVAYVPIQPIIDGFVEPTDVLAGFDELIYVVDAGTEEIISLDEAGREIGRLRVPNVTKIAQDRRLQLLALGRFQTDSLNFACIYRIDLVNGTSYSLSDASIIDTIVHPFDFNYPFRNRSNEVQFNGIAVMGDNSFYVTRSGPDQTINRVEGPDDAILVMNDTGGFQSTVNISANGQFFRDYFRKPQDIATFAQPPQISVNQSKNFIYTSADPEAIFKARTIRFVESDFGANFEPEAIPVLDTSEAVSNAFLPFRFQEPSGVSIAGAGTNFIFITDTETDSLYQFTINGDEGVNPPPSSPSDKLIPVSFGGEGQGPTNFVDPVDAAFLNDILYVVDKGNRRLLRFQLTSDFD